MGLLRLPSDVCFVLFAGTFQRGDNFPLGAGTMVFALAGFSQSGECMVGVAEEIKVLGRSQLTPFSPFQHASRLLRFILLRSSSVTLPVISIVVNDCHL